MEKYKHGLKFRSVTAHEDIVDLEDVVLGPKVFDLLGVVKRAVGRDEAKVDRNGLTDSIPDHTIPDHTTLPTR